MKRISIWLPFVCVAALSICNSVFAQQSTTQEIPARPRQTKPNPKPGPDQTEKPIMTTPIQEPEDLMRKAITNLTAQIGLLTDEMRKLRKETERNSLMTELLLNEDRLAKL